MSTLTRRDRVALGAVQGGALYYGDRRRWPEPAPGVFEKFPTPHPGSITRPPGNLSGHALSALTVSDLDGTPKIYSGYGSITGNVAPVYIWPMSLDGVWDATYAHSFNAYGLQYYLHADGKLWAAGLDGAADFCTGSPGGLWVDGVCAPTTFVHPFMIARHDGYTWVCGQAVAANHGAVWRGTHPTGADGEFVFDDMPPGETLNRPIILFSYQGKLWYQALYLKFPENARLRYWDEPSHTFIDSGLHLDFKASLVRQWKTVMLSGGSAVVESFNGTTVTKVYEPPYRFDVVPPDIVDIWVTPDDTAWILDAAGVIRSSTDLITWKVRGEHPAAVSFTVYGDYIYVGDTQDHIWRAKATA